MIQGLVFVEVDERRELLKGHHSVAVGVHLPHEQVEVTVTHLLKVIRCPDREYSHHAIEYPTETARAHACIICQSSYSHAFQPCHVINSHARGVP